MLLADIFRQIMAHPGPVMSRPPPKAAAGLDIDRITADSRQVRPGDLFVAIQGVVVDGRDFIPDAVFSPTFVWYDVPVTMVEARGTIRWLAGDERARVMSGDLASAGDTIAGA